MVRAKQNFDTKLACDHTLVMAVRECDAKSILSSVSGRSGRQAMSVVTIAQLKCQQVQLPAQSNYSGHQFRRVIGSEAIYRCTYTNIGTRTEARR